MKRGAKLAVLAAALAVLVGAWLLAESMSGRREEELAEHAHGEPIDISVGKRGTVTAIAWNYFGDAASLYYDGTAWVNANDETCPIDGAAVQPLAEAVASLTALDAIEGVTDFQQYGLAESAFTVVAGTADNIITYEIGNATADGTYYVRLNGGDTVYTESGLLAPTFCIALDDVLKLEAVPADMGLITGLAVETDAGNYTLEYLPTPDAAWYTSAYPWFLLGEDGAPERPLDSDKVDSLCSLATGLRLTDCVSWTGEAQEDYGLTEPQGVVQVTYRDDTAAARSFTLEFGDYDNGDVYVRFAGSKMVYRVAGTVLDGLMYPDFAAMEPLSPMKLDWDKLESMYLEVGNDTYIVTRSVSTPMTEDEEPEDIYTSGERSLDAEKVAAWLRQLSELTADSRTDASEGRETLFSLTFRQNSERYPEITVEFRAYDSVHYLCVVNGTERYLVSRTAADNVEDKALEFLIQLPLE